MTQLTGPTMSRGVAGGGGSGRVYNPSVYQPTMMEQQGVGDLVPDTMDGRMNLLDRYNDLKAKMEQRGMSLSFDQAAQLLQVNPQQLGQVAQSTGVPAKPVVPVAGPTMEEQQAPVVTQPTMEDQQAPVVTPAPSMEDQQGTGFVPLERPNMATAQAPRTQQNVSGSVQGTPKVQQNVTGSVQGKPTTSRTSAGGQQRQTNNQGYVQGRRNNRGYGQGRA